MTDYAHMTLQDERVLTPMTLQDEQVLNLQKIVNSLSQTDETIKINDVVRLKYGIDYYWQNVPMIVVDVQQDEKDNGYLFVLSCIEPQRRELTQLKFPRNYVEKVV